MDWIPILVAAGGAAGVGALLKSLFDGIIAIRSGVSATEGKRRSDLAQMIEDWRNRAYDAEEAERIADDNAEAYKQAGEIMREYAVALRFQLLEAGVAGGSIPPWPAVPPIKPKPQRTPLEKRATP